MSFYAAKKLKKKSEIISFCLYLAELCWSASKSIYRSCAGRHFYGTEYEIMTDFGLVAGKKIMFTFLKRLY